MHIVSKVQERIVFNKLYTFLSTILAAHQSGFKKNDGTHLQLSRLDQEWSEATDSSNHVAAVFFDIRKAFDRVWHRGLVAKLSAAGASGSVLAWFENFLS